MSLKLLEKFAPNILEQFPDGIIAVDMKTMMILDLNSSALQMLGYKRKDLLGKEIFIIRGAENKKWIRDIIKRLSRERLEYYCEMPCIRKSGEMFFADIASAILEYGGN